MLILKDTNWPARLCSEMESNKLLVWNNVLVKMWISRQDHKADWIFFKIRFLMSVIDLKSSYVPSFIVIR